MIGTLPSWVGDATAICALLVGIAAVVGLVLRAAKPGLIDLIEKALAPRFEELHRKIDASNRRLDEHMRREETQGQRLFQTIAVLLSKVDRHERRLEAHVGDAEAHR